MWIDWSLNRIGETREWKSVSRCRRRAFAVKGDGKFLVLFHASTKYGVQDYTVREGCVKPCTLLHSPVQYSATDNIMHSVGLHDNIIVLSRNVAWVSLG
jgi:hypothetical protein